MKIAIGSDHKGVALKTTIKNMLVDMGAEVLDLGPQTEERVDYPDYGEAVARAVASGQAERGIAICASGVGMCITANKVPGVRAVLCQDLYTARMSRLHNDTNVLCLGALVVGEAVAQEIVRTWLEAEYEGGRHQQRLDKIAALERAERA
ncbi:MAG: ribose 5-phosphate isomerase B [Chloroflexi bacterium]|jgi:ribose 5-phosphate isomerase B|nr:ribose 5-phosphate isomerase B [Chloroflexota bacterium]